MALDVLNYGSLSLVVIMHRNLMKIYIDLILGNTVWI